MPTNLFQVKEVIWLTYIHFRTDLPCEKTSLAQDSGKPLDKLNTMWPNVTERLTRHWHQKCTHFDCMHSLLKQTRENVQSEKYLGITINDTMDLGHHISEAKLVSEYDQEISQ